MMKMQVVLNKEIDLIMYIDSWIRSYDIDWISVSGGYSCVYKNNIHRGIVFFDSSHKNTNGQTYYIFDFLVTIDQKELTIEEKQYCYESFSTMLSCQLSTDIHKIVRI